MALAFGALFVLLVASALAAPLWANDVAHTDPATNHLTEMLKEGSKSVNVVALNGIPVGPQWFNAGGKFFLGADGNGRDIMVRLLYGARTSLEIGVSAALITTILSVIVALFAGYLRGIVDTVLSRIMDIVWSFPVVILGVALGTALSVGGLKSRTDHDPERIAADPDPDHRLRLRALHGAAAARPGSIAARKGVHRGRARPGNGIAPDHVLGDPAQPRLDDRRVRSTRDRERDPARGLPVVPRRWGAAADAVLGHDDQRRASS